ncbi:hypothetical protein B0H10DRAFT_1964924 [Mycena sp. CBHHK59/15]|nr:hypothetical protein B0H10DRAFT_1964924 [Mycena sp. CBHHK59/15]
MRGNDGSVLKGDPRPNWPTASGPIRAFLVPRRVLLLGEKRILLCPRLPPTLRQAPIGQPLALYLAVHGLRGAEGHPHAPNRPPVEIPALSKLNKTQKAEVIVAALGRWLPRVESGEVPQLGHQVPEPLELEEKIVEPEEEEDDADTLLYIWIMIWVVRIVSGCIVTSGADATSGFAVEISHLAGGPNICKQTLIQAGCQYPKQACVFLGSTAANLRDCVRAIMYTSACTFRYLLGPGVPQQDRPCNPTYLPTYLTGRLDEPTAVEMTAATARRVVQRFGEAVHRQSRRQSLPPPPTV